jgi:hypothetical protein
VGKKKKEERESRTTEVEVEKIEGEREFRGSRQDKRLPQFSDLCLAFFLSLLRASEPNRQHRAIADGVEHRHERLERGHERGFEVNIGGGVQNFYREKKEGSFFVFANVVVVHIDVVDLPSPTSFPS